MRLRWRKVRYANIPKTSRDLFERFGENIIASIVATNLAPRDPELQAMYPDPQKIKDATEWLTERGDIRIRQEHRLETVQWAILVFAALGVIASGVLIIHEFGWLR